MAQRLIRVLYDGSKELAQPHEIDHKYLRLIGMTPEEAEGRVYKPVPCAQSPTGFKGRKAIFEMMIMDAAIRDAAFNSAPVSELRKLALQSGMRPLVEDGKLKVLNGTTTPDEIARVSQVEEGTGVID